LIQSNNNDCSSNEPEPQSTNIHFYKYLCEDYSDVYGNDQAANFDHTGGNYGQFANAPNFGGIVKPVKPTNNNEALKGCELAQNDWYFNLSDSVDGNYNQNGFQQPVGPTVNGVYSTTVSALPTELKTAIKSGQLWVSEVKQQKYPFAALRCYQDALNGDNLEFITLGDQIPSDIYCIAYNIGENPRPLEPCGTELILNGGFENPIITHSAHWNIYPDGDDDLAWRVKWVRTEGKQYPPQAELHEVGIATGWAPAEGNQYTELDTDFEGPGGPSGEDASVTLYQKLTTVLGSKYTIKFSTSPRPNQPADQNKIGVKAGDLDIVVNEFDGGSTTNWTNHTYTFIASGSETIVEFTDLGPGNSFGGFLDAVSVKQDCNTDVEICKIDNNQQPLAGWTVFLKGEKADTVKVYPDGITHSSKALPAGEYVLEASGTYVYRPGSSGDISDAGYTKREPKEFGGPADPYWLDVNNLPSPWQGYLGIQVDGVNPNWGPLDLVNHQYSAGKTLAVNNSINFRILDSYYEDNSGYLVVDIYPIYKGTTGNNGCVILQDVPFGNYTLDEIMKDGWEAVSGKGDKVEVTSETARFTLVNKCTTACEPNEPQGYNIRGTIYHDVNNNGQYDVEDPDLGLKDWIAYIDLNNNDALDGEEPSAASDINGNYELLNLPAGCYTVREVLPGGWEITEPVPTNEYIVALGVSLADCPGAVNGVMEPSYTDSESAFWNLLVKTAHAELIFHVSDLDFGNYPIDRGGNQGGGSRSSGSSIPEGQVLGDSTGLPYQNPQVLGETTELPRTGTPLSIIFSFIAILGIIILPKLSIAKLD
jgi:hypothetical protein